MDYGPLLVIGFLDDKAASGVLAVVALVFLIIVLMRRTAARGVSRPDSPRSRVPFEESGARQPLRGEAERLLVELQEFGREMEGRLETRIHHLTRLLAEADKAIEALTAAVAAGEEKASAGPPEPDALRARIVALAAGGMEPDGIARAVGLPKGEVELVLGLERNVVDRDDS